MSFRSEGFLGLRAFGVLWVLGLSVCWVLGLFGLWGFLVVLVGFFVCLF